MSQMSREDMLRELELLPVWQLRQPLPVPSRAELPAADKSDQVAAEQAVKEHAHMVPEPATIDIIVAESSAPEPSVHESSIPEPASTLLQAPVPVVTVAQQLEVAESFETVPAAEPVQPLRLLLSEDSRYAFLIEPYAAGSDVQQVEILLKNMIRAMQTSCRVDVTDTADKIFAVHRPKLMISLGAEPANRLSGKTYAVDAWRSIQQESQPSYEQIPLTVTYHPAHLLVNTADKALAWHDLCAAIKLAQNL